MEEHEWDEDFDSRVLLPREDEKEDATVTKKGQARIIVGMRGTVLTRLVTVNSRRNHKRNASASRRAAVSKPGHP